MIRTEKIAPSGFKGLFSPKTRYGNFRVLCAFRALRLHGANEAAVFKRRRGLFPAGRANMGRTTYTGVKQALL